MSFHEILIAVMAVFALLGAADRIFGNRWGLGKEFEEGILAMGSLALAMVGVVSLAPVLAAVLKPVVVPLYSFFGADPAMFAGTILASDMGGGALAMEMTEDYQAAMLGEKAGLSGVGKLQSHLLQRCGHKKGQAAEDAGLPKAGIGPFFKIGVQLTQLHQGAEDHQGDHCHGASHSLEGHGADEIHACALGYEGAAPNNRCQQKANNSFEFCFHKITKQ